MPNNIRGYAVKVINTATEYHPNLTAGTRQEHILVKGGFITSVTDTLFTWELYSTKAAARRARTCAKKQDSPNVFWEKTYEIVAVE